MKSKTTGKGRVAFINIRGNLHSFDTPKIMGIINVTPDSFFEGSRVEAIDSIVATAKRMMEEGAWCLDVGGYSSRPGADDVPVEEEIKRIKEPIQEIRRQLPDAILSIDTFRTKVAEVALEAGADLVNDISGGHLDENMYDFVADVNVPYIAMHMKGTPQNMKSLTSYDDMIREMIFYFSEVKHEMDKRGLNDLIFDPGLGFAKTADQNFQILNELASFDVLEVPLLVGASRKSMIFKTLGIRPEEALNGTTVLNTVALLNGASILRVHDVHPAREAIQLTQKLKEHS